MKIRNMILCGLFAALLALCAWISLPAAGVIFTLQTFGIALTLLLLGGKRGTIAVVVYLLLGIVGLPVFTGFQGGLGTLLNVTGGYIVGFLAWALLYWLITTVAPQKKILAMVAGLLICYGFGTFWFYTLYLQGGSAMGLGAFLLKCLVPYLLPDAAKLSLAFLLATRLKRFAY